MKELSLILVLSLFGISIHHGAQTSWLNPPGPTHIQMHQQCHSQACIFSSWKPNQSGNLLVAVIRTVVKTPPLCTEPHLDASGFAGGCGNSLYLVSDTNGNQWQRAYGAWTSELWYALDAKPGINVVGVMASYGFDDNGNRQVGTGGDFSYDVTILEYPPAVGLDAANWTTNSINGSGDDDPHTGAITTTAPNDLLIFWTNNRAVNNAMGPLTMTANYPFVVENDDGYLAVADAMALGPGTYTAQGHYNGYCLWNAGMVAFKMK
jgi:hypothetical protein